VRFAFLLLPLAVTLQAQTQTAPLTLADLEQMALANNPAIPEAAAGVHAAAGMAKQAGLYPNPNVGYSGEQIRGGQQRGGEQGFFVSQTIVLGGKLGASRRVADQVRQEAETTASARRQGLLNSIRTYYYEALAAQRLVDVRRNLSGLARDAVVTANQLGNVGQADRPDILQAEVEAEQADLALASAEQSADAAWKALAIVVGKPELPLTQLAGDFDKFPRLDRDKSWQTLVEQSPALKLARQEVERAQGTLAVAKKASIPDLMVTGGLQQNFEPLGAGPGAIGLQGFATIGVQIPIFNRNQGNVEAARAGIEGTQQQALREQLELRRRFTQMFRDYAISSEAAERYARDMLPRAQRAYELYLKNYQAMAGTFQQVLLSQRTLFQLEADHIQALERVWRSVVAIQGLLVND
jgi:cobalt-zinc-cadmium efflux system outer membrane protein